MNKKILHIAPCDEFIPPFIEFVKDNFEFNDHEFLLTNGVDEKNLNIASNVHLVGSSKIGKLQYYSQLIIKMQQADKVILHSLFDNVVIQILFYMPWLLNKCYWVMWGGDLYIHQFGRRNWKWKIREFFRRPVIKNMGNLVTYVEGDVNLARKWYKAKGNYQECLMYVSNLYQHYEAPYKESNVVNIQVGNSADPSNNHMEVLEKLLAYKDKDIHIYIPLSYGDDEYAKKIIDKSKELFGNKVKYLTKPVPFDEYLKFLGSIDIAIFNHKRQQAMGNTITLLGLGKTVFIRSDTTQWQFFKDKKIEVYDSIKLHSLYNEDHLHNIEKIKEYFSTETLINQLTLIFD